MDRAHGTRSFGLSKSRIAAYEQCPKRLWLSTHKPEHAAFDDHTQAQFVMGQDVGEVACALCPGGVMVDAEPDLLAALATTRSLIDAGHPGPIFEATFSHDGVLVRVDVLERMPEGAWAMREVKSSTGVKDYHLGDLATQIWVLQQAGIELGAASIRHINRDFTLQEDRKLDGLFRDHELLAPLLDQAGTRGEMVAAIRAMLAGDEPATAPGPQCNAPFACEFSAYCNPEPEDGPEWPVSVLPHGAWKRWEKVGIVDLLALDEDKLGERDAKIVRATRTGQPFHDREAAHAALESWQFPRAWLDFETIAFAVPRWVGTRPYEQVPFQFSVHLEYGDGTFTHHEFLSTDGSDPRQTCAEALIALIPEDATPIAYNASFERGVLRALAASSPQHAERLLCMADRTVDLLPVARSTWYHRDQRGSWSIKSVLPTIADLDYSTLSVQHGGEAQAAYIAASDPATDDQRRADLIEGLRVYCRQDTWAMVLIAHHLAGTSLPVSR